MSTENGFKYCNVFPKRIVLTQGEVLNENNLLNDKLLQITTNEKDIVTLKNTLQGKNAFIVLDFGKEIQGKLRILTHTTTAASEIKLRITYGESVAEALSEIGFKGACNDHSPRDFTASIPQYSDISFNESGFRFAKIELLSKKAEINIKAVIAISGLRDIPYLGTFTCNDKLINQIYETCAYTCHLNMQQYMWDGIKRDRLVWVGDMHPEMLTVRTVFGCNKIIDDSLNFMRLTTKEDDWMNGMPTYSCWWIHILYDWYLYSGNQELLDINKSYALNLIFRLCKLVNSDGSDNFPAYFLDWPCNNKPEAEYGSLALLIISLRSAERLSEYYNDIELKNLCAEKLGYLLNRQPKTYGAKQVIAMCALAGWVDSDTAAKEILNNGASGWSTFMSYYILKAASQKSMSETLEALRDYYGGMLKMGATTFWEDFDLDWLKDATPIDQVPFNSKNDIHGNNGAFCYKGYRHSLCHGWSSAPAAFLAEEVLGIHILEPGCKKLSLKPNLGSLEFAKGTYPTPYGIVSIECKKINGETSFTYTAPDEIEIIL